MALRRFEKKNIEEQKKKYALTHCPLGYSKCIRDKCKYWDPVKQQCKLGCIFC